MSVRFLLNGEPVELGNVAPTETALQILRTRLRRTGTKEGCGEGDCGACTVMLGELDGDEAMHWRAVNACILFAPMLDGRAVVTVEGIGTPNALHPVQREMVARHGSQCGFCTPGIVMSLYCRAIGACGTQGASVADVLSGNLCRCTGYGPILASGEAVPNTPHDDSTTIASMRLLQRETMLEIEHGPARAFVPQSIEELASLRLRYPHARFIAGATDVGLWVTKQLRELGTTIFLDRVRELQCIVPSNEGLTLGAGVRYAQVHAHLTALHPELGELVRRIAGTQVRNMGTIGGNIANGSPIGDMPPALIALGATLTLRQGNTRRTIRLEDYFIDYGRQDLQPGEFVESLFIPRPAADAIVRIFKLSKRFDSDISAVCGAFMLRNINGVISEARIAFGGMAATPKRALACEKALTGKSLNAETAELAAAALAQDFAPLNDVRGSSVYRMKVAGNLLRRIVAEQAGSSAPLSLHDVSLSHG